MSLVLRTARLWGCTLKDWWRSLEKGRELTALLNHSNDYYGAESASLNLTQVRS